ncbi:MAG: nucleotide exchange factor GrpE [Phycisphaerales bacterium]|nr:nucleotide exchange factor GrpE [Phycisphaerales bacterium]
MTKKTTDHAAMPSQESTPVQGVPDATDPAVEPECDALALLQKQLDERTAGYLRALADLQNFQRRSADNELRARNHGVTALARAIVPVLEHLDVAIGHDLHSLDASKLAEAIEAFREDTLKALAKCGVERVEPKVGDEFDPTVHEAVMQQASDAAKPGHVAACLQAGYRFGEMALRSAKVAVAPGVD